MKLKIEEDWPDIDGIDTNVWDTGVFSARRRSRQQQQHYGTRNAGVSNPDYEGTCRLMQAVLKEALTCYQLNVKGKSKRSQRLFEEVATWVEGGETQFSVFSFDAVCDVVGVSPQALRTKLRAKGTT